MATLDRAFLAQLSDGKGSKDVEKIEAAGKGLIAVRMRLRLADGPVHTRLLATHTREQCRGRNKIWRSCTSA